MSNLGPKPGVVLFVRDVRRLSQFYRHVADMSVIHEAEDHVVLELAGFQLVIHALCGEPEPSHDGADHVVAWEDAYLKVCLPVRSLARARARAAELSGLLAERGQEWEARGFLACDGHDPEGNVLQLREPAA